MSDHKQELEQLATEYRVLLAEAGEAYECGNMNGAIGAQRKMAANVSRRIVLTLEVV
jgi:hypothetical protein